MTFRLERQSSGKTLTKFFVYDDTDSIVGTINVAERSGQRSCKSIGKTLLRLRQRTPPAPLSKTARYQRWSQPSRKRGRE